MQRNDNNYGYSRFQIKDPRPFRFIYEFWNFFDILGTTMDPNSRAPPQQLDPHLKHYYSSNNSAMGLRPHCNPHPLIPPNPGLMMLYIMQPPE